MRTCDICGGSVEGKTHYEINNHQAGVGKYFPENVRIACDDCSRPLIPSSQKQGLPGHPINDRAGEGDYEKENNQGRS